MQVKKEKYIMKLKKLENKKTMSYLLIFFNSLVSSKMKLMKISCFSSENTQIYRPSDKDTLERREGAILQIKTGRKSSITPEVVASSMLAKISLPVERRKSSFNF